MLFRKVLGGCLKDIFAVIALAAVLSGCASFTYKDYQGRVDPDAIKPYDLSQNTPDAPVIYFDTATYREVGVPFHRLLLVTHVDDQPLMGAGQGPLFDFSGYQAVKVTPGKHSLGWCWVSKNSLGTGGGRCGFKASGIEFIAGQRYVVTWSTSGVTQGHNSYLLINSQIKNLDTQEVVFRGEGN